MLEMGIELKRGGNLVQNSLQGSYSCKELGIKYLEIISFPQRYEFRGIASKYHFGELKFIHDGRSHEIDKSDN